MKPARYFAATLLILLAPLAHGDVVRQLTEASRPLSEGVPEVAVTRLQNLLKQNLSEQDWRAVAEKLLEAMVAANQTADALKLADDPRLRQSTSAAFWHAQLLATMHREAEALALYRQISADARLELHNDAVFGEAEMLRALGKTDEALQDLNALFRDPKWSVRAQLRAA